MSEPAAPRSRLVCAGCGEPAEGPLAFRCPNAGRPDDTDHVLEKRLDWRNIGTSAFWREAFARDEPNPFLKFRELLHVYHAGLDLGLTDAEWVERIQELDERVAKVDGRGFRVTPFVRAGALEARSGIEAVYVKDETGNVSGSHKGRHLFGVLIALTIARRVGLLPEASAPRLAIASCGNAALAAAVLARAVEWPLVVFVPPHADAWILSRLRDLGADLVTCARSPDVPGDPCVHRFLEAIRDGAVPFSCQGNENGLVIDGGETLGYEIVASLLAERLALDHIFVQVGGGALASATAQALRRAHDMGSLAALPRFHAVQTEGCFPLARAWQRFRERFPGSLHGPALEDAIAFAATHRASFMQAWPTEPKSLATGILDDETYDWLQIVRAMAESGGAPIVAPEERLARSHDMARGTTSIAGDPTGTAGLAGLIASSAPTERHAILITGAERSLPPRGA